MTPHEGDGPGEAGSLFGERLPLARAYAQILATRGVEHGLIGPREVPRLWVRHLLNCAAPAVALPAGGQVIDVGSGGGLPGLVLAIARPDVRLHLVEPMLRRTAFLADAVAELGLGDQVTIHRGRAEELTGTLSAPMVTARAVARLDRLAGWCLPLLEPHGELLALKGSSAPAEVEETRGALRRLGSVQERVETYGEGLLEVPTTVVRVTVGPEGGGTTRQRGSARRSRARRARG